MDEGITLLFSKFSLALKRSQDIYLLKSAFILQKYTNKQNFSVINLN